MLMVNLLLTNVRMYVHVYPYIWGGGGGGVLVYQCPHIYVRTYILTILTVCIRTYKSTHIYSCCFVLQ